MDFGLETQTYAALQWGVREGDITPKQLDAALGKGEKSKPSSARETPFEMFAFTPHGMTCRSSRSSIRAQARSTSKAATQDEEYPMGAKTIGELARLAGHPRHLNEALTLFQEYRESKLFVEDPEHITTQKLTSQLFDDWKAQGGLTAPRDNLIMAPDYAFDYCDTLNRQIQDERLRAGLLGTERFCYKKVGPHGLHHLMLCEGDRVCFRREIEAHEIEPDELERSFVLTELINFSLWNSTVTVAIS